MRDVELNEGENDSGEGDLERLTLAGSRLALEILEDGAVSRQPGRLKVYARLALRLMDLPPCGEQLRVAAQYQPGLTEVYRDEIRNRLADGIAERRLGAWRVLLHLAGQGCNWARSLADEQWPNDGEQSMTIFQVSHDLDGDESLGQRWCELVPQLPPRQVMASTLGSSPLAWQNATPQWARTLLQTPFGGRDTVLKVRFEGLPLGFSPFLPQRLRSRTRVTTVVPVNAHSEWHWLASATNFAAKPSKDALARFLTQFPNVDPDRLRLLLRGPAGFLSWPLDACLSALAERSDLGTLIDAVQSGRLGDKRDWDMAERRWMASGVTAVDLGYQPEAGLPFDRSVATLGFPATRASLFTSFESSGTVLDGLLNLWRVAAPTHRRSLADGLLVQLACAAEAGLICNNVAPAELARLIADADRSWLPVELLSALPSACWTADDGEDLLNLMGNAARYYSVRTGATDPLGSQLELAAVRHPTKGAILGSLTFCVGKGSAPFGPPGA
jgi:hypothetical protein